MDRAFGMLFEFTIRRVIGHDGYGMAGLVPGSRSHRALLQRVVRVYMKDANGLDTSVERRSSILGSLGRVNEGLKAKGGVPSWELVYELFNLTSRLLGYDDGFSGEKRYRFAHWQSEDDFRRWSTDAFDLFHAKNDAVALRRAVVVQLHDAGVDDFKIALVLNTTEYAVKVLRGVRKSRKRAIEEPVEIEDDAGER